MKLHANARLSVKGRELLVDRIERAGWSLTKAAVGSAVGMFGDVPPGRSGAGLADRSRSQAQHVVSPGLPRDRPRLVVHCGPPCALPDSGIPLPHRAGVLHPWLREPGGKRDVRVLRSQPFLQMGHRTMKLVRLLAALSAASALLLSPAMASTATQLKRCGSQAAGGFGEQNIRVGGTSCATGHSVARAWIQRVEAGRCSRFHCRVMRYVCRISRPPPPFTVTCASSGRRVRWDISE